MSPPASAFIRELSMRDDVVISEFILLEMYLLLRNPAVLTKPLDAAHAVNVCACYRRV